MWVVGFVNARYTIHIMNNKIVLLAILAMAGLATPVLGKQIWAKSYLNLKAPELVVEKWLSDQPATTGKFLLIDFWATWCPPCRASIPELNEIHRRFGDRVVVIGISDEPEEKVKALKEPKIDYFVAIDTQKRMKDMLEVKGIPHVILVDPSGVVRWEGFPLLDGFRLTPDVVGEVIAKYGKK